MKTLILFIGSALLMPVSLLAQNSENNYSGGGGGFTIGMGFMDVSKLHAFVPSGVPSFNNTHLLLGGTGHGIKGKLVIGGSGFGIVGNDIRTDSFKVNVGGGLGTFDIGYLLVNKDKVKLFPMIGIGGGGFGVSVAKNKSISAANASKDPGQEIKINAGGLVFDLSLNLNLIPVYKYDEKDKAYGGFMTGLKIGYAYGFPTSNWSYTGGDVTGGPKFGINMFYFKLIIGGFGYTKS